MGDLFGGKRNARIQAAATLKAANDQAAADRLAAQQAQMGIESAIAQSRAAEAASEKLNIPMDQVEVDLAPQDEGVIDSATGRRRPQRVAFQANRGSGAGINI